jgi:hypothetical protein
MIPLAIEVALYVPGTSGTSLQVPGTCWHFASGIYYELTPAVVASWT